MRLRADRLVVDTNVLISAALGNLSPPRRVLDAVHNAGGVLLFSDETFREVHSRLLKPKFDRYVPVAAGVRARTVSAPRLTDRQSAMSHITTC